MKAYVCDRCGETFIENKTPTNGRIHGGYLFGVSFVTERREIDWTSDLCDECLEDLFDFMNNKTVYERTYEVPANKTVYERTEVEKSDC